MLADFPGFLIVCAGVDSPIQPVLIKGIESRPKPVQFSFVTPQGLVAPRLVFQVTGEEFLLQPCDNFRGNDEITQSASEAVF